MDMGLRKAPETKMKKARAWGQGKRSLMGDISRGFGSKGFFGACW